MIHIFPIGDLKEHTIEGTLCDCHPDVDWQSAPEPVVVHHPFDGRRQLEIKLDEMHINVKILPDQQDECGVWEIIKEKEKSFEDENEDDLFV